LKSNIYGFILGILSPLSNITKLEPWMVNNIKNSYNAIAASKEQK